MEHTRSALRLLGRLLAVALLATVLTSTATAGARLPTYPVAEIWSVSEGGLAVGRMAGEEEAALLNTSSGVVTRLPNRTGVSGTMTARDVSQSGLVVGEIRAPRIGGELRAFVHNIHSNMQYLVPMVDGFAYMDAAGITEAGLVFGSVGRPGGGYSSYIYDSKSGNVRLLSDVIGFELQIRDLNDQGWAIGVSQGDAEGRAVAVNIQSLEQIHMAPPDSDARFYPQDINDRGVVVGFDNILSPGGGTVVGRAVAFDLRSGSWRFLAPAGTHSSAHAVNEHGIAVGTVNREAVYFDLNDGTHGSLGTVRGTTQWQPTDINDRGVVVGMLTGPASVGVVAKLPDPALPNSIGRLYRAYFLRDPDAAGRAYWVKLANSGTSLSTISSEFAKSPEFRSRYGTLSDHAFVELIYRNVLSREPDAGGLAYWTQQLNSHTRGWVMIGFSESPEFRVKTGMS